MGRCKKKIDAELEIHFPGYFGQDINYVERLREYEEMKLRKYFGEDVDKRLFAINEYFLNMIKPRIFNPYHPDCILIENDRRNEDLINAMEESGLSVKKATVFEFYNKIRYLENRAKKLKQHKA